MPLCSATTTIVRPARNTPVRQSGQGRDGCLRATLTTPHRYNAASAMTDPVTTGAPCHCVSTACQPNAGSIESPSASEPTCGALGARSPPQYRTLPALDAEALAARIVLGWSRVLAGAGI